MHIDRRTFLQSCGAALALGVAPRVSVAVPASRLRRDFAERPVRDFLKIHFASSRDFTARGLDQKERLFTRRFRQGLYKFFEKQSKSASTQKLVIDPFTGSQGASDYSIGDARVRVEKAWVPVTFSDGRNRWTITYYMRNDQERNDERWRIDDIEDVRGMMLSKVLKDFK